MHRTYSMRQSRLPTASQIENPPPPLSSTKTNRIFGKGGFGESSPGMVGSLFWMEANGSGHSPMLGVWTTAIC